MRAPSRACVFTHACLPYSLTPARLWARRYSVQSWYWEFIEMVLTLSTPSQPCLPPLLVFFLLLTGSMHAGAKADLDLLSRSPVSRLDGTPGWLSPHHLPVPTRPNAAQAVSQSGTKCFPTALTCLGKRRALCVCTCSKHTPVTRMCAHIAMCPYTCCGHAGGRSNSHIINLSSNG